QELVVFRDGVRCSERPDLDLPRRRADGKIGHERVLGLARACGHDGRVTCRLRLRDHVERPGERAVLVRLDEDAVRDAFANTAREALAIRREEIVADYLHLAAEPCSESLPAGPVLLGERVLDGDYGKIAHPAFD